MPTLKALELAGQLQEVALKPVCALVGQDDALRARCLRMLKEAAAPPGQPGSTVREFEHVPQARDVFDELRTVPFLGLEGRRVVVIEKGDAFLAPNAELLVQYLKSPSLTGTLILCLSNLAGSTRVGKAIHATGAVVDCAALKWAEAERWVRSRAAEMGKKLTPRAASSLVRAVGPNLLGLENELEKLAAYCEREATITERDVGEVVAQARARSIFDLGSAVSRADAAEAMRLCQRLLLRGEKVPGIVSILAREVRHLWEIKRLLAVGASQKQIERATNLRDFVVRRALPLAPGLSEDWFARRLKILSAADVEAKTTSLRSHEERVWLEKLLARLCEG